MAVLAVLSTAPSLADGGVTYDNIARGDAGLDYTRVRSPQFVTVMDFARRSLDAPLSLDDRLLVPEITGGSPGVALLDADGDGDLDIYVSNGPGAANSLFSNQLAETGTVTFVDVAEAAGVAATDQDSAGVCFGDLDNDGDHDLVVLGRAADNRLFANHGDGTFSRIEASGIEGGGLWSSSCTLGDVDGDGLLDLFVANTAESEDDRWILAVPFALSQPNQLFHNDGGLAFSEISATSGIGDLTGLPPAFEDSRGTVTWAAAMVDIDLDGDQDILHADDQAAIPPAIAGGLDRGLLHVLINDGGGFFTDRPILNPPFQAGTWMGLALGDLDCNGTLDLHATNFGDYGLGALVGPAPLGLFATRWLLGTGDGTFTDPGVGDLVSTPFAWGNAIFDYDNDADLDIVSHGGLDTSFLIIADNPGTILRNQGCSAEFVLDRDAIPDDPACTDPAGQPLPGCTEHIRRNVRGVAVGDLDRNGFNDIVTVSDIVSAPPLPLIDSPNSFGTPVDETAFFVPVFAVTPDGGIVWTGLNPEPGDLAVELADGNRNGWAAVTVRGSIGLTSNGRVNRDGIGAVLSFTPSHGPTTMVPVTGGSSFLSQHSLERTFGLGAEAAFGTVEVLWPGGRPQSALSRAARRASDPARDPVQFRHGRSAAALQRLCQRGARRSTPGRGDRSAPEHASLAERDRRLPHRVGRFWMRSARGSAPAELVVMSWAGGWGQGLETAVSRPFAEATGIRVRHAFHIGLTLPPALTTALDNGERPPFDIVWSNGVPAMELAHRDLCEPLDEEDVPHLRRLSQRARPEGFSHWPMVLPYVVYYVLAYRDAVFPDGRPESWSVLMDPRHRGKIALYPGGNGIHPIAQVLGGGDVATIPHDMAACWDYLRRLRPQIGELDYSIGMGEMIRRGRLDICFRALTNAIAFRAEGLDVSWVAPREGVADTLDALWVPRHVPRDTAAWAKRYIDFALSEPVQRRWSEMLGVMPMHRDVEPPVILRREARLPRGPDDLSGVLHISEAVKLREAPVWERRFKEIFY